jgi:hypothetical protein
LTRVGSSRQRVVAGAILGAGFVAAFLIYLTAPPPADALGPRLEDSKRYLRQMELYGGKANVFASGVREWFEGLWHGKALASTVACLSVVLAAVVFIALQPPAPGLEGGRTGQDSGGDPDSSSAATSNDPAAEGSDGEGTGGRR